MALYSMTAFARSTSPGPNAVVAELRSVNHRYLDCHFKLPESLRGLEAKLRERLAVVLGRGKVDCQLRVQAEVHHSGLSIDEARLAEVLEAARVLQAAVPDATPPAVLELLQFPGICAAAADSEEALARAGMDAFEAALLELRETRAREGEQLGEFLRQRMTGIAAQVGAVREALPELRERQEERLRRRLGELAEPVDEGRIEQELVLLLQKSDVDEELDRLDAHLKEVERVLRKGGPCGRRLDFLMQELNREANTLSSKSTSSGTTQSAVELKVLIEQMREQVQNLE